MNELPGFPLDVFYDETPEEKERRLDLQVQWMKFHVQFRHGFYMDPEIGVSCNTKEGVLHCYKKPKNRVIPLNG